MDRPEKAEFDDVTAPDMSDLSASDIRAAFASEAFIQGFDIGGGATIHAHFSIDDWKESAISPGGQVHGRTDAKETFQPFRPMPGEIARARQLAEAYGGEGDRPALTMQRRLVELLKAPVTIGEVEASIAALVPLSDQACAVLGAQHLGCFLLGLMAGHPDPMGAIKVTGVQDQAKGILRYCWTHIAIAAPHLLQMRSLDSRDA